jgi:hypothetical protein
MHCNAGIRVDPHVYGAPICVRKRENIVNDRARPASLG